MSIDYNLYDRQIRTYGIDALEKIISSSVTIIGLENGLGTEIAKNLALGGVKNIYLYDNGIINEKSLETGYYFSEQDIGKINSEILIPKIQELNSHINVKAIYNDEEIKNNSIIVLVNKPSETILYYEEKFNTKLIAVFSKNIYNMIFVNAGESHHIIDVTGEDSQPVQIGDIDEKGYVYCVPNVSHKFQVGDYIKFENLEGRNIEYLYNKEFVITEVTLTKFKIDIAKNIYIINGTV